MPKQFMRMYLAPAEEQAEASTEGSPIRFVIATEGIKRDGLDLKISGARVDNYLRNPIVTWVHDFMGKNLPIGRANLIVGPNQMEAEITFDPLDDFARQVESKYRRGYLNAVSVSWNPLQMNGRNVEEWEFLDLAAVPLPGDPDALMKRQYEALKDVMGEGGNTEGRPQGDAPTNENGARSAGGGSEDGWAELAAEMVDVFLPGSDEDETLREGRYRALLPRYRRMGKVAPEWLSDEDRQGLGSDLLRGHFLEGEWEMVFPSPPAPFPKGEGSGARKGAVLSTRNLDDLRQAVELIQGVLERARKEEPTNDEEEPKRGSDNPGAGQDGGEAESRAAFESLQSILDGLNKLEV
jgi:hypothetical protein